MKTIFSLFFLVVITTISKAQLVKNTPLEQIIPSTTLPQGVVCQNSNNNLDLMLFKGRYYVGFRTAPSHFASRKTKMYVMSTLDFKEWKLEKEIALKSDVREPRFYASEDTLFFMFFKGGTHSFKFEPNGIFRTSFDGNAWEELAEIKEIPRGFVPWRIKRFNGTFYLSSYEGINEYKFKEACELRLYVSTDGKAWQPISKAPQLDHPRAIAELAFAFNPAGDLWGVSRLEFDGAYIMHAKRDSLDKFEYWYSKYKFDSPYMFKHNDDFYLISRRNLKGPFTVKEKKYKSNLVNYSFTKKTTALFKLDTTSKALIHIQDFGTTGDCAFPSVQKISDTEYIVLDYSCNIKKKKKNWITGQLGKTYIYKTTLTFDNSATSELKGERFEFVKPTGVY